MPSYELTLIIKQMAKLELVDTLKRAGYFLLKKNAVVRRLENLGTRRLPHKYKVDDKSVYEGSYFVYYFDAATDILPDLLDTCLRDVDIINSSLHRVKPTTQPEECTLEEELKPPAHRKNVLKLLEEAKKKPPVGFQKHTDEI